METHEKPPPFAFGNGHPSSPPMTPGSRSHARFPPRTSHTSPMSQYIGLAVLAQSPPLEFIEPIGRGPHFLFSRPQSRDHSRPSTASGRACATSRQESDDESESDQESTKAPIRLLRRVQKAEFILEELDSDPGYDSAIEVIHPDHYEDAWSDSGEERLDGSGIIDKFRGLHCEEGSSEEDERLRRYRKKKKRWSAGIFKRTYSQSVEGDSSYSDNDPLDDVDSSARRLRRRVRGPADPTFLLFEDQGFANVNHIVEVEEPEDRIPHSIGPPSIPSDDGFRLDELPFWDVVEDSDSMEVEDEVEIVDEDDSESESNIDSSDEDEDDEDDEEFDSSL
ncbi:hypothetical protein K504DRAFT_475379 [Pleomassaria siparia CBS 279.74]|uniref:Uncharacterized protein n=1 Tax=Pleomassaria siparia CBS 279.74 TaxID=1314801 RepID=A0A6G1KFC5_9PLEO|nr:hypothetical protein K504DRAFT_475379 [Pleomassaria siparia CBS 279.74]